MFPGSPGYGLWGLADRTDLSWSRLVSFSWARGTRVDMQGDVCASVVVLYLTITICSDQRFHFGHRACRLVCAQCVCVVSNVST